MMSLCKSLLLALPLLLLASCERQNTQAADAGAEKFDSPWLSEEHWLVASTVRDLQAMATLAGAKNVGNEVALPTNESRVYQIGEKRIKMQPSCWDLASYDKLISDWKFTAQEAQGETPALLEDLLTPTATALQKANHTISDRLKATPAAPAVHEEAAFLLGVFGIRENARKFGDLRPLLCRMTAHLAFAQHLRNGQKPSALGEWALVFYDFHAGRPIPARERLQSFTGEGETGTWQRATELLITKDWRQTKEPEKITLLEAIAHARAIRTHSGYLALIDFVEEHNELKDCPEWTRLLLAGGHSVQIGHLAMRSINGMELKEIREIFPLKGKLSTKHFGDALSPDQPAGLVATDGKVTVISDSDWAAYFRRHLFISSSEVSRFTLRMWDSDGGARKWENSVGPYCRVLPGHELIEPLIATKEADFQEDLKKTAAYIKQHPERVPMGLWYDYQFPNLRAQPQTQMPDQISWFREASPPATAHDPAQRIRYHGITGNWFSSIQELHQIDPWNAILARELTENGNHTLANVEIIWGEMMNYSKLPLNEMLKFNALTLDERIDVLKKLVLLDVDNHLDLGAAYVLAGREEEAYKAYAYAFENANDRVKVSNSVRWLIYYYKKTGQDAKAREVADDVADVYSAIGLESAMALAIAEKETARAQQYAKNIADRYNDMSALGTAAWFAAGDESALREIFPNGLQPVTLADLDANQPLRGVRLLEESIFTKAAGLRKGDVVLAIDGQRIENISQYETWMYGMLDPKVRIIYQRGKTIAEANCLLPDRRFRVDIHNVGG